MNSYEFVFITKSEEKSLLKSTEKLIASFEGTITKQEAWGKKGFAYMIDGLKEGYYFVWEISINSDQIIKLKNKLNLEEEIVRYLVLKRG